MICRLENIQCSCKAGIVLSHPSGKNKYAARVGHPLITATKNALKQLAAASADGGAVSPFIEVSAQTRAEEREY